MRFIPTAAEFLPQLEIRLERTILKVSPLFSDHMVFQRGKPIRIWGEGNGEITVFLKNQTQQTQSNNGKWFVTLAPEVAGGPFELKIKGEIEEIVFCDVMIGDVWLAAGQSNMECVTFLAENGICDAESYGNNDKIRLFTVPRRTRKDEEVCRWHFESVSSKDKPWEICTPDAAKHFSAIGFWFASMLQIEEQVPIGIISCNFGGTCIESWIDYDVILNDNSLSYMADKCNSILNNLDINEYTKAVERNLSDKQRFCNKYDALKISKEKGIKEFAVSSGLPWPEDTPMGPYSENFGGVLFENMIKQIAPISLSGVLWYQGESNVNTSEHYFDAFRAMVGCWRNIFADNLPFFTVQIAPFGKYPIDNCRLKLNYAQAKAAKELDNVYLVSTEDLGETDNIHPLRKKEVAERLFCAVQSELYGKFREYCGPLAKSIVCCDDRKIIIDFSHAKGELVPNSKINDVYIVKDNGELSNADAYTFEDKLVVTFDGNINPIAVKMGNGNICNINLYNINGIHAVPFYMEL